MNRIVFQITTLKVEVGAGERINPSHLRTCSLRLGGAMRQAELQTDPELSSAGWVFLAVTGKTNLQRLKIQD